jgi:hypothetical protein
VSRTCAIPGCGRKERARGLCSAHETRSRRGRPLTDPVGPPGGFHVQSDPDGRFGALTRARFASRYTPEPNTGCWLWTAGVNRDGYGQFGAPDGSHAAHRYSLELVNGPIPDGLYVCHKCDQPACVNPDHLFLGTQTDNMHDAAVKGRTRGGVPKLSKTDLTAILAARGAGDGCRLVGRRFGVSQMTVWKIWRGDHRGASRLAAALEDA